MLALTKKYLPTKKPYLDLSILPMQQFFLLFEIIPFTLLSHEKLSISHNKMDYIFYRYSQIVGIHKQERHITNLPYATLSAYCFFQSENKYQLIYQTRSKKRLCKLPIQRHFKMVCIMRDFLAHYLNPTLALPDVPALEPYRQQDPTSRAHDSLNKRPPHFWQQLPTAKFKQHLEDMRLRATIFYGPG